jgi:hypothetical protein
MVLNASTYLGRRGHYYEQPGDRFIAIHDMVTHESANTTLDGTLIAPSSEEFVRRFDLVAIAKELALAATP